MAPTTTPIVATNCVIKLDSAAGTLVDISGVTNSVEFKPENAVAEYRVFGTVWKQRKAGIGKDAPITIKCVWSTTAAEALGLINGWFFGGADTARTLNLYVPDGQTGSGIYAGEYVLKSWNIPLDAEADDVVRGTIELLPHGVVSHGTIGS